MAAEVPVPGLGEVLQADDTREQEKLLTQYAGRLGRLAQQYLSRGVAARVDSDDVVQSVFRTFLRRRNRGEFRIDTSDDLWRLLGTITVRKARAKARRHCAGPQAVGAVAIDQHTVLAEALSREPGPDELTILADEIAALVTGFSDLHAKALALRLQGHSASEIASELQVSRRTVERALKLLRERLARRIAD